MKITKQARQEAKQLFRSCQINGRLDENRVRQAVQLVLARKPRGYLPLLTHFQRLVKLDLERRTARVESAVALEPAAQTAIRANLQQRYGAALQFTFATQPSLVGGLRIRVGSDVYDGSIQARLAELAERF